MIVASILETRQSLNSNSMRWSGRRGNQLQHRKEWVAPDLNHSSRPSSVMSHYSDPTYVIGNSTTQQLERIARLFKFGGNSEPISPKEPRFPIELPPELPPTPARRTGLMKSTVLPIDSDSEPRFPLEFAATRATTMESTVLPAISQPQLAELEGGQNLPLDWFRLDEQETKSLRSALGDQHASPTSSKNPQMEDSNIGYRGKGKAPAVRGEAEEGGFF